MAASARTAAARATRRMTAARRSLIARITRAPRRGVTKMTDSQWYMRAGSTLPHIVHNTLISQGFSPVVSLTLSRGAAYTAGMRQLGALVAGSVVLALAIALPHAQSQRPSERRARQVYASVLDR